jgi:hypothetical protein
MIVACAAGNVARLLETNVGVCADGEAVFLAMQAILQSPNLGRGFSDLARRPYRQVEPRDFAIGVFAGFGQRADQGIAEFSFENNRIIWSVGGGILLRNRNLPPVMPL